LLSWVLALADILFSSCFSTLLNNWVKLTLLIFCSRVNCNPLLYIFLTLLAMLALVITFFANPIGKYYAQSYAQKLLKTPVEISQLNLNFVNILL
jgi:hypothetical protein